LAAFREWTTNFTHCPWFLNLGLVKVLKPPFFADGGNALAPVITAVAAVGMLTFAAGASATLDPGVYDPGNT